MIVMELPEDWSSRMPSSFCTGAAAEADGVHVTPASYDSLRMAARGVTEQGTEQQALG